MSSSSDVLVCLLLHLAVLTTADDSDPNAEGRKLSLKFCANLEYLYHEGEMLQRYDLAKQSGFRAVECAALYEYPLEDVVRTKEASGLEQILINVYPGDESKGEHGFAALPDKKEQFQDSLRQAINYCKALKCKLIHILAGKVANPTEENDRVYEENLRSAAAQLGKENIVGVIEPINKITVPTYYMNSYEKGLDFVKRINCPHIRLLADLYHWKMMDLNLTKSFAEAFPYIAHMQVAQAPDRHEPDTCGTIHYKTIFPFLEAIGYKGWIGLEYKPIAGTVTGLKWIKEMGYSL